MRARPASQFLRSGRVLSAGSKTGSSPFTRDPKTLCTYDPLDWSELSGLLSKYRDGQCFDKTVFDDSPIPMSHLQKGLPSLPVAGLDATLKNYEEMVQPLVSPETFEATQAAVADFRQNHAHLHSDLVEFARAHPHTSYISADWFDAYLRDRAPLPIHYNPTLILRNDPQRRNSVARAASLLHAAATFEMRLHLGILKPEIFYFCKPTHYCREPWFEKLVARMPRRAAAMAMMAGSKFQAFPLDMSQFVNLFHSTRLPKREIDVIRKSPRRSAAAAVLVNGYVLLVDVVDSKTGSALPPALIAKQLATATSLARAQPPGPNVGALTSLPRDKWADVRARMENGSNGELLTAVDDALLVMGMDGGKDAEVVTGETTAAAGHAAIVRSTDRWWDKSVSINVNESGTASVQFEHAWGDGVAVLRATQDVFNAAMGAPAFDAGAGFESAAWPNEAKTSRGGAKSKSSGTVPGGSGQVLPVCEGVVLLDFKVDASLAAEIDSAVARLEEESSKMDYWMSVFTKFGKKHRMFKSSVKNAPKPDAFQQMAMQLAWWRLHGTTVSTYESASTAAFKHGRTECIRTASMSSKAFTEQFGSVANAAKVVGGNASTRAEVRGLLDDAIATHGARAKAAKMGKGVDRVLFAMRKIAERKASDGDGGATLPALYTDEGYKVFGSNILSTSSLYSDALVGGGFGPVSPGYGIGYAAGPDLMVFSVSCWKGEKGPGTSAADFGAAVEGAIVDMENLIVSTTDKK